MKHFTAEQLERAIDLYEHVDANRWEVPSMRDEDKQLQCEFWTFKARALLADKDLAEPDQRACLWVLGVARAIAAQTGIYVHGLSRYHSDNWAARARATGARTRARQERRESSPTAKQEVTKVRSSAPEPAPHFPALAGATIVVVGGEPDNTILGRFQDADFTLDWTPTNIRQVQALVERIKSARSTGSSSWPT